MENICSMVPYLDPTSDDNPSTEDILMFSNESPSLGFNPFPEIPESSSRNNENNNVALFTLPEGVGDGVGDLLDPNDPLSDPFIWEMLNDSSGNEEGSFEAGPSGINGEIIGQENVNGNCDSQQGSDFGNPIQLSIWPVPPSPYTCSCCQILREIIHTNGIHITNLEIHGRLGIITHAVLDKYDFDFSTQNHVYQMFDFCKESIISVKNFLVQYCEVRKWEGYTLVQDPLSIFYDALCVGFDEKENLKDDFQPPSMVSGHHMMSPQEQGIASQQNAEINGSSFTRDDHQEILRQQNEESSGGHAKSSLATQRERTGKMKLKDFSGYFHLTINDAAKKLRVCPTVIKKKCREAGLPRWPYRKIKGIKRKISMKEESLSSATAEERARTLAEIQMLEQELANIFEQLTTHNSRSY